MTVRLLLDVEFNIEDMRTNKHYSVCAYITEKCGLTQCRYKIEGERYVLSESDIRSAINSGQIKQIDVREPDVVEIAAATAKELIARNGHEIGGSGGIKKENKPESVTENNTEE